MRHLDDFIKRGQEKLAAVSPEGLAAFNALLVEWGDVIREDAVPLEFAKLERERLAIDLKRGELRVQERLQRNHQRSQERTAPFAELAKTLAPVLIGLSSYITNKTPDKKPGTVPNPNLARDDGKEWMQTTQLILGEMSPDTIGHLRAHLAHMMDGTMPEAPSIGELIQLIVHDFSSKMQGMEFLQGYVALTVRMWAPQPAPVPEKPPIVTPPSTGKGPNKTRKTGR